MKKAITLIVLFFTLVVFGQGKIQMDIGDFSELKVYDLIEVKLISSNVNKVVISGANTENVKAVNNKGTLKIRMQTKKMYDGKQTFVEVYYTSISVLDANEGAKIVSNETIQQSTLELRSQEGARIKAALKVNHLNAKAISGGIVELSGTSTSQEISINSGGIFEGRDLKTKDTVVSITAAGEAEVYASDKVDIKITAGGNVKVYGNPSDVKQNSLAGGTIEMVN